MRSGSTPGHAACLVPPLCWALAASLHLPGAEAEDQQAEDGSGRALAPSEDGCQRGWLGAEGGWAVLVVTVQAAPGAPGLGSCSGKAKGCCSALRNRGPAGGPPALAGLSCPQCWRSSRCRPNAPLQSGSDPQALPSPGPTAAPISKEKESL